MEVKAQIITMLDEVGFLEPHRRLMEGRVQIITMLDEVDRHISWVKEQDQARQYASGSVHA